MEHFSKYYNSSHFETRLQNIVNSSKTSNITSRTIQQRMLARDMSLKQLQSRAVKAKNELELKREY